MGALRLSVKGEVNYDGSTFEGRVVTYKDQITVRHGKDLLFDQHAASIDKISGRIFNFTLDDGSSGQIKTKGCGCRGSV